MSLFGRFYPAGAPGGGPGMSIFIERMGQERGA